MKAAGKWCARRSRSPAAGAFTTLPLSGHATTQIALIGQFLEVAISVEELDAGRCLVRVG